MSAAPSLLASGAPVSFDTAALLAASNDAASYGALLSDQLFADRRVREAWLKARAFAAVDTLQLRLNLDPADGGLHALRWETLCDPETSQPIALQERVRFVRAIDSDDLRPVVIPPHPALRALVVVAAPGDLAHFGLAEVDVQAEVERIRRALDTIPTTILGRHPDASGAATVPNLIDALRSEPHLVFLVAHGTIQDGDAFLWLEHEGGAADRVSGRTLAEQVARLTSRPLLLALSSCNSAGSGYDDALVALGPLLARVGVPAVLGFQGDVSQATVQTLLPALIAQLRRDGRIDQALAAARGVLKAGAGWWQAVLWLRTDGRLWRSADDPEAALLSAENPAATVPQPFRTTEHCPYPGLRTFTEQDQAFFFGRERDLDRFFALAPRPIFTITGISGVGKSSFVRAGIIPRLTGRVQPDALVVVHRVTDELGLPGLLTGAVAEALSKRLRSDVALQAAPSDLLSTLREAAARAGATLWLVLDQFEELFATSDAAHREERAWLLGQLIAIQDAADPQVRVLITTLETIYAHPDFAPRERLRPFLRDTAVDLGGIGGEQLREIIVEPVSVFNAAHGTHIAIEPQLVDKLIEEFERGGSHASLPLLQYLLALLWPRPGGMTVRAYEDLGRLEGAFKNQADKLYFSQSEAEFEVATALLTELVRPADLSAPLEKRTYVRRRLSLRLPPQQEGQPSPLREVIRRFTSSSARLITCDPQPDGQMILELTHDVLLERWDELRKIQYRDLKRVAVREELRPLVERWRRTGGREVLSRGAVKQAHDYLTSAGGSDSLHPEVREAVGVLNAEIQACVDASRRHYRWQVVYGVLALLLLLALGVGAYLLANQVVVGQLFSAQERADQEQARADREQLRRASLALAQHAREALSARDVETALLLGIEAGVIDDNPAANAALRAALGTSTWQARVPLEPSGVPTSGPGESFLTVAPAGERFAALRGGLVYVWDAATGEELKACNAGAAQLAFSPDGMALATVERDRTISIYRGGCTPMVSMAGHPDDDGSRAFVRSLAWHPDGSRLLSVGEDGFARVWDTASGEELLRLGAPPGAPPSEPSVSVAAWRPDGDAVAVAWGYGVTIWDTTTGTPINRLDTNPMLLAWRPDGKQLLTAGFSGLEVWDSGSGARLATLDGPTSYVRVAQWGNDGARIMAAGDDGAAFLWDAASFTRQQRLEIAGGERSEFRVYAELSPDGTRLATAFGTQATVWDVAQGVQLAELGSSGTIDGLAWGAGGDQLVLTSSDRGVRIWQQALEQSQAVYLGHSGNVLGGAWQPGGSLVATTALSNLAREVAVWDSESGEPRFRIGADASAGGAVFSPDGRTLLAPGNQGLALYQIDGSIRRRIPFAPADVPAAWSADSARILVAGATRAAIFDASSGAEIASVSHLGGRPVALAWHPAGQTFAVAWDGGDVQLWDVGAGEPRATLRIGALTERAAREVAWSPDGSRLLIQGDRFGQIWAGDASTRELTLERTIRHAAWSPEGAAFLVVKDDNTVDVRESAGGATLATLRGHRDTIRSASWRADGRQIITASADGTARIWSAEGGQELVTIEGLPRGDSVSGLLGALWSPDGARALTFGGDERPRVHAIATADLVALAGCRVGRSLTAAERNRYQIERATFDIGRRACPPALTWQQASSLPTAIAAKPLGPSGTLQTQQPASTAAPVDVRGDEAIEAAIRSHIGDPGHDYSVSRVCSDGDAAVAYLGTDMSDSTVVIGGIQLAVLIRTEGGWTVTRISPREDLESAAAWKASGLSEGFACLPTPGTTPSATSATASDPRGDVEQGYLDIVEAEATYADSRLTLVIRLADLPDSLPYQRAHVPRGQSEYEWGAEVVVALPDGSVPAGRADYWLTASAFSGIGDPTEGPLQEAVQPFMMQRAGSTYRELGTATLTVDTAGRTITLVGLAPDLGRGGRLLVTSQEWLESGRVGDTVELSLPPQ